MHIEYITIKLLLQAPRYYRAEIYRKGPDNRKKLLHTDGIKQNNTILYKRGTIILSCCFSVTLNWPIGFSKITSGLRRKIMG